MVQEVLYSNLLPYAATFLAFFAALYFLLKKSAFKGNNGVCAIISISISLLIVWGLTNYTNYITDLSFFFDDLTASIRFIIFAAVLVGIAILLGIGFKKFLKRSKIPWLTFAIAGLLIAIFFIPNLISVYYLPDILADEFLMEKSFFAWACLISGILVAIYGIKKVELGKIVERNTDQGKAKFKE